MSKEEALGLARQVGRNSGQGQKLATFEVLIEDLWWMATVMGTLDELVAPAGPLTEDEVRAAWEEGAKEVVYEDKN